MGKDHALTIDEKTFYAKILGLLDKNKIPFLIGGSYAVMKYIDITRETKDLDIFCRAGDYPKVLKLVKDAGFQIQIEDERWIAKIRDGKKYFIDLIYTIPNSFLPIDDECINRGVSTKLFGRNVKIISPEDLIWSKAFRMFRERDNADVKNTILKTAKKIDWKYLLRKMDGQWEILLVHLLEFRYIYPSNRNLIPKWLMKELIGRLTNQLSLVEADEPVCRGLLLSNNHYKVAVDKWGYLNSYERP